MKPGAIVLDCGASVGDTVEIFARKGAVVHAFEPNPVAAEHLKKRFARYDNVQVHQKAVFKSDGKTQFFCHANMTESTLRSANGSSLLGFKSNVNAETPIEVETIDLVRFISELNTRVAVLKIDIEGAEIDVVNHLLDHGLQEHIDLALVETHEDKIPELVGPTEKLRMRLDRDGAHQFRLDWQ